MIRNISTTWTHSTFWSNCKKSWLVYFITWFDYFL